MLLYFCCGCIHKIDLLWNFGSCRWTSILIPKALLNEEKGYHFTTLGRDETNWEDCFPLDAAYIGDLMVFLKGFGIR